MNDIRLTAAVRNYVHVNPIAAGTVRTPGLTISVDSSPEPLQRIYSDPSIHVGEVSFAKYLAAVAAGDRSVVALPVFVLTSPRHRCFFVPVGSQRTTIADLAGRPVGTEAWATTGNIWARSVMRWEGVAPEQCAWWVGPIAVPAPVPDGNDLPDCAQPVPEQTTLLDMVARSELDALVLGRPPEAFYSAEPTLRRLIPDFVTAEKSAYRDRGFLPAHHVIAVRRSVVDRNPGVVDALVQAFSDARAQSNKARLDYSDASPWLLSDLENAGVHLGDDWQGVGVASNAAMTSNLCKELFAQGIVSSPVDPDAVFADYEAATGTAT